MISVIILHPNNTPKATKNDIIPGDTVDDVVRHRIIVMFWGVDQMESKYYHWRHNRCFETIFGAIVAE